MTITPQHLSYIYTLLAIIGVVVGLCAWAIRAIHPTKAEIKIMLDEYQKKELCTSKHDFGNQTMADIKANQTAIFAKLDELTKIVIRYFGHEREKQE